MAFAEINGLKLYYEVHGSGRPLVLLNGIFGSAKQWGAQVEELKKYFQVYVYDYRDQGQSETCQNPYRYEAHLEDLKELLAFWGLDRVNIFGISQGAVFAMLFTVKNPERVEKLVLASPVSEWSSLSHHLFNLSEEVLREKGLSTYYRFLMSYAVGEEFFEKIRGQLEPLSKDFEKKFKDWDHVERVFYTSIQPFPFTEKLAAIKVPTLIIAGDEDRYTPLSRAKIVQREISGAKLVVIPKSGHTLHLEQPEKLVEAALEFLL